MSIFNATSNATEVVTAFADEIRGKNVLITGTSPNGLGYETARAIAQYANLVIVTGYDRKRLEDTKQLLLVEVPNAQVRTLSLNLVSMDAVRAAAAEVLINNAASSICAFQLTADGFERQIATDHLGPFLFTSLILPRILAAGSESYTPRIVFVASGAHAWCDGVDLAQIEHPDESKYEPMRAYAQAKSANILTASELARRFKGRINAYSLTPGGGLVVLPIKTLADFGCSGYDELCLQSGSKERAIETRDHHRRWSTEFEFESEVENVGAGSIYINLAVISEIVLKKKRASRITAKIRQRLKLCGLSVNVSSEPLSRRVINYAVKLVWAYMLLGQLVAISVASNLFYLALVLSPPVSGSRTNAKASPVLFACVSMALGAVYLSPWTDGTTFLPNLLVMHGVIMIPLLLPAKFVKNSERSVLSVPLPMMHILVFAIALALHTRSTATALGDPPMSVLDFVNKAWTTLHSHPAQASIGWDIIWTSISFVVWVVMLPQEQAGQRIAVALFLLLATPLVSVGVLAPHILRPSEEEVEEKKNV
ncbi:unnamed protein product [Mycena citricolor]|uniref:Uncharacterized protein n=1 Tax=Mycena citricolor TaxID=2018698 RepID=A0AAD2HE65_9AGAR|nr:unnamed protein product [Mycena citricolor]